MARCVGAAATLPGSGRKDLALQALARSAAIRALSVRHSVSRKFVYQQAHKASAALDKVFLSGTPEDDVLFHLTVSKTWLRQVIVALTLMCRSSYRGVVVGLHDEIFQGTLPVLAGVDAASTYCYLLAVAEHRDADTWGVHLLDAARQGLKPDYTIADAGQGLRAGQKAAWDDTPCHGDVFHITRRYEGLAT